VGPSEREVVNEFGVLETVPPDYTFVRPGDPALSRRVKVGGGTLTVSEMRRGKRMVRGIWAPADRVNALRAQLEVERSDPAYRRKLEAGRKRREDKHFNYVDDFRRAVHQFLNFHPESGQVARTLSSLIAAYATPVGSGTVARTRTIPIEQRAEAATMAWLRHQTTNYDRMQIARNQQRREVRHMLAQRTLQLLQKYRSGQRFDRKQCPLHQAVQDHLPELTLG
jgi:hypothetical protein